MKPINRMYLISILLFVGGICGFSFGIGWIISSAILILGILMFFSAIAAEVPDKEKKANPYYWDRKSPFEEV